MRDHSRTRSATRPMISGFSEDPNLDRRGRSPAPAAARRRRAATRVLLFWSASLLLGWLQPCCEALAAAVPHDHAYLVQQAVAAAELESADHRHESASHNGVPAHTHCAKARAGDGAPVLPVAVMTPDAKQIPDPVAATAGFHAPSGGAEVVRFEAATAAFRPPPIYLVTLRLRI